MELYRAMESRRSIRKYKADQVPQAAIDNILRAAQAAPSWKNRQAWHILLVRERGMIQKIGKAIGGNPRGTDFDTLPMLMLVAMDEGAIDTHDGKPYYLVDAGIVGEHIVLAAEAEGLGTCWVGWFEESPVKALLGIPDAYRLVMITPLGYPAEAPAARPRKALADIVHEEKW